MKEIPKEDERSDACGRIRMYRALILKQPEHVEIPGERTVYRVMQHRDHTSSRAQTGRDHESRQGIRKAG